MAPPVSAARKIPYPGISTYDPNGITLGSTAITFGSLTRFVPSAV